MTDTRNFPKGLFDVVIGSEHKEKVTCQIRGLVPYRPQNKDDEDDGIRWIHIDGNFTNQENDEQLKEFLTYFGTILSSVESETLLVDGNRIGTG